MSAEDWTQCEHIEDGERCGLVAYSDYTMCPEHASEEGRVQPPIKISLGSLGWSSVFHSDCPESRFGGIVAPDGPRNEDSSWHALPDGNEIRAYVCNHCGVRFFAGLDKQYRVTVVPR